LSASRGPPFIALSRQGGYAHILKGYFYTNLGGTLIKDSTGSFADGLLVLAGAAIVAMVIVLALGHDTALERTPARDPSPAE
jgi:hypothetical protein